MGATYSFIESHGDYSPVIKEVTYRPGEKGERFEVNYIDLADYFATGKLDGLSRLMTIIGMYVANDKSNRHPSIFVEAML